jgi:site-specific recombinase XerD
MKLRNDSILKPNKRPMTNAMNILFFAKKSKTTTDGLVPIYMRVTIDGQRFEVSVKRYVKAEQWSASAGRLKGNHEEAKHLNSLLDAFKVRAFNYQREILTECKPFTIETYRVKWLGLNIERPRMLLEIFEHHNKQMKELIGQEFSPLTFERYTTSKKHTHDFMKWKYNMDDMNIKDLNYEFITDYEFWLKSVRKCDHNTTMKYLTNFKKIVNICLKNGWLDKNPFIGFKMTKKDTDRPYLSQEELELIKSKTFVSDRLNQVRDIFLFSCYTGLAYVDTQKLTPADISIGIDGEKWIFTKREKTETPSRIPLLPPALEIIDRYCHHPKCLNSNKLLPLLSNQKMNGYLHEIEAICGINKNLTYHTARHTFATTITLTNGVPIESVSKMLGHKSLRTTQHYAKILDKKVSEDMGLLRSKFSITKKVEKDVATS